MPKMIVSIDGVVIKEVPLTKDRTTIGRRPYNDVVIDNLAISGEHAVLHMPVPGGVVEIEDLQSTNGTYINATPVKRQPLRNGDTVELGKYKIRFVHEAEPADNFERTMVFKPGMAPPRPAVSRPAPLSGSMPLTATPQTASIRVLTGPAAGREVVLTKVVTTIGKPGAAVASINKRHNEFVLVHVEGEGTARVNGVATSSQATALKTGDRIELAGTEMEFVLT
ncbi:MULTISPECIES: FHA domain-containing protein [unclassified Acidovorax]|uniref:FHA domain-containing protein n=1 Tax=unclassified Acidovorax TaxID=2684926 RepID=UPI002883548B|nr:MULTISPECIES: FHA domain-containing protein [unclassified Acidovorax]